MAISFLAELRRRNVVKVGIGYVVAAWLLIQMVTTVLPTFDAPAWIVRTVTFLLILGLPFVLVFAWAFEITLKVRLADALQAGRRQRLRL